ncbi:helix-turn-helix domain-containing protein [Agathobaculum sp.]|uniref:helix-turn-helix domain-containing protein n=1 Tax=Agathobaculum sp. TaxID=2048138 RepID=UPI002A813165|nr:helix-turn-helix transcriptional regulator [Agathobaculum sp.]MDY3618095.1 helix-turn-helix transcriptional regulator [Agathobaculum sp.]
MTWFQRIRALREDNDYTQEYVAKLLGIKQSYYSDYERNQHELPIRHIIGLADLYGVTTDYLLGRTDDPKGAVVKQVTIHQRDHNTNIIK